MAHVRDGDVFFALGNSTAVLFLEAIDVSDVLARVGRLVRVTCDVRPEWVLVV